AVDLRCWGAGRGVSTWAKMPRTVSAVAAMTVFLHRGWNRLLHLHHRHRRHQLDEAEKEDEEPGEAADDDRRVGERWHVDAPRVRIEVVAERRDDDVEALEPHPNQDQDRNHVHPAPPGPHPLPTDIH